MKLAYLFSYPRRDARLPQSTLIAKQTLTHAMIRGVSPEEIIATVAMDRQQQTNNNNILTLQLLLLLSAQLLYLCCTDNKFAFTRKRTKEGEKRLFPHYDKLLWPTL